MSTYRFALADEHFLFNDDNHFTYTSTEQKRIEDLCKFEHERYLHGYLDDLEEKKPSGPVLHRNAHIKYALKCLDHLSENYMTMDASRAWFCFWGLHSLRLLGHKIDLKLETRIIRFLEMCQHPDGGYGGAPGQFPHLATTYAAVMALISLGTDEAFNSIDREKLYAFLTRVKHVDGGFVLHEGGERDIRGAYCAISVAMILNIGDEKLFDKTAEWIVGCQTYEGGFGGEHDCEAHGGYTFCGVAGLALLRKSHLLNIPSLLKWLVNKQMCYEGGFQGRTNKLVDACYSFWQAATFFTIEYELSKEAVNPIRGLFNEEALQQYLLICCQDIKTGGLRDKPEKNPDLYHTCYGLAGLAIAQSYSAKKTEIVGGEKNALNDVHPLYNVCMDVEQKAKSFFSQSSGDN